MLAGIGAFAVAPATYAGDPLPSWNETDTKAAIVAFLEKVTTDGSPDFVGRWVSWGAGTRAAQFLILGGKTRALLHGRTHVTADDVRALVHPVFRHRILVGYRAEAEGVSVGQVIDRLLEAVPER